MISTKYEVNDEKYVINEVMDGFPNLYNRKSCEIPIKAHYQTTMVTEHNTSRNGVKSENKYNPEKNG